jgi:hypothetical protein
MWEILSVALCKVGVTLDQCDWKSEVPDKLQWKFYVSNFNEMCETIYGMPEGGTLWTCVNQALF